MDIQIEQQKLSNLLLQNITELLRVPDSEKERQLSIEMGVKFLVNASKDPDLYDDALEEFHKAKGLRKQDYFVLHRLGTIYLYTEKHMNPEKALEYFLLAGKYASVESDPKAMRLANVMTKSFDTVNSIDSTESIQHLAADSYERAAFAAYVLGRFDDAENHQKKALKLNPSPQNRFILAKYSVRNGNTDEAVKCLDKAIDEKPELLLAVFKELDLANEKSILDLVKSKNESLNLLINKTIGTLNDHTGSDGVNLEKSLEELKELPYLNRIRRHEEFKLEILKYKTLNSEIDKTIHSIRKYTGREGSTLEESLEDLKNEPYSDRFKIVEKIKMFIDVLINPKNKEFKQLYRYRKDISFKYTNIPYSDVIEWGPIKLKLKFIKIGNINWMEENLSVDTFRNGDPIPEAKTDEEWKEAGKKKQPAWCWSTDDPEKRKEYGKLYNGYAVLDSRGLAPEGYLIPTDDELKELIVYGKKHPECNFPRSGKRDIDGKRNFVGSRGLYWSCTVDGNRIKNLYLIMNNAELNSINMAEGISIRCIVQ
jgi:tetratricopeptide (TPR) repeat protein